MLELKLEPTKVQPILEGMITEFGPLAETNGITLRLDPDETTSVVLTDPYRLEQVLRNLLNNSLKFTTTGGIVILKTRKEGNNSLHFEVSDTGIGIDESNLKTILEPLRQAANSSSNGTGLGLPICCRLLTQMNAKMQVQSKLGVGSKFSFSLQLALNFEDLKQSNNLARNPGLPTSISKKLIGFPILIADDNDEAREVLKAILNALGCTVETAKDGIEALKRIETTPFKAVLLDIQMPRLDGIKTAEELHQRFASENLNRFKLIAVTGNSSLLGKEHTNLFDKVLSKPVGISELKNCLEQTVTNDIEST
jgi:CheY-like chemotaxis protein